MRRMGGDSKRKDGRMGHKRFSMTVMELMRDVPINRVAAHAKAMGLSLEDLMSASVYDFDLDTRLAMLREVGSGERADAPKSNRPQLSPGC